MPKPKVSKEAIARRLGGREPSPFKPGVFGPSQNLRRKREESKMGERQVQEDEPNFARKGRGTHRFNFNKPGR